MSPDDFTQTLDALEWKQADFCRKAGLDKNTPSRWVNGKTPIPAWVPAYLGAMLEIKRLHQVYVQAGA
jgi:hypothetical protein